MKRIAIIVVLIVAASSSAQERKVNISFSPESDKFAEATSQYQNIWNAEGGKIVEAMERVSGLKFRENDIKAIVYEGVSQSGYKERPMKLRASYPADIKKATLIHELGHRLKSQLTKRPEDIDEHRILFLYLYEVWTELYGKSFADAAVEVEKKRKGLYDYEAAWDWALALSKEARASRLKGVVELTSRREQ